METLTKGSFMSARYVLLAFVAIVAVSLSACAADTHLRHDDTSRSSGEIRGNPY